MKRTVLFKKGPFPKENSLTSIISEGGYVFFCCRLARFCAFVTWDFVIGKDRFGRSNPGTVLRTLRSKMVEVHLF